MRRVSLADIVEKFLICLQSGNTITIRAYNIPDAVRRARVNPREVRSVFKTTQ